MPQEASGDVQRVADELEIRNLVARYSNAVAARDEKAWAETWTADAVWKIGGSETVGRDQIVSTWLGLMDMFETVVQVGHSGEVDVQGDTATGRWMLSELGWGRDGGASSHTVGLYEDTYRRTDAGWRFAERRFNFLHMGPPDLSGRVFPHPSNRKKT